jgi:non-structural maintenance of chromosomes element 1
MFETYNTKRKEIMAITGMQAGEAKFRRGAGRQSVGNDSQSVDKGVTGEQVEKLLAGLVKENWLERSKDGFYRLSPRALMELRTWLVDTYNDSDDPEEWQRIKFCEACKEIVTVGQRCADLECNVRLHNICESAYWNSRPGKKCPKCETAWDGKRFVGEKAMTTTEDYLKGKRRSGGKRSRPDEGEGGQEEPLGRKRNGKAAEPVSSQGEEEDDEDQ